MGPGSSDRHTSGCQESWEKPANGLAWQKVPGPGGKRVLFSAPGDWQELACPGAMLSFSLLSIRAEKKNSFSSCQDPMAVRRVLCWSLQGPGLTPHLLLMAVLAAVGSLGVPAKAGGLASLGMCTSAPRLDLIAVLGRNSPCSCPDSRPSGIGVVGGQGELASPG